MKMDVKFHELLLPQEKVPEIKTSQRAVINGKEADFDLKNYNGSYMVILFLTGPFHSNSEHTLTNFSKMGADFENVECKPLAITKASTFTIKMWLNERKSTAPVIPIVADQKEELIRPFGVLHNDNRLGHPANAVFIVDGNSKVRYLSILEPTVDINPEEILELVQQFQSTDDGNHVVMSGGQIIENSIPSMKKFFETSALSGSVQPSARKQKESLQAKKTSGYKLSGRTDSAGSVYTKGSRSRSVAASASTISGAVTTQEGSTALSEALNKLRRFIKKFCE